MGFWRSVLGLDAVALTAALEEQPPTFAVDVDSIDPAVFGIESYASATAPAPRIDRKSAIQVPAVKRARDMICPVLAGLPLDLVDPTRESVTSSLFAQPEKGVARSVTMTRLFEDLLFEGVAWWEITEFGWHTYPVFVKRIDPRKVDNETLKREGVVYVDGRKIEADHLIRFESPNDPLLVAGARAIRTLLKLDAAAAMHADGTPPLDYFTATDPDDPPEDDEVATFLAKWREYRRANTTGYIPPEVEYHGQGAKARDLQLAEARNHAVLEIARIAGIDPEDLGVSTTSRTYANREQRLLDLKVFTFGPYVSAVQDRLTMGDVTPRGYVARLRWEGFLASDAKTRFETYKLGLEVGALAKEEIRPLEDKPDLRPDQQPVSLPAAPAPLALPAGPTHMLNDPVGTFDFRPAVTFGDDTVVLEAPATGLRFEVDQETRVVRGLLVPYGVPALSKGQWWQFAQGTLSWSAVDRVKLWIDHDSAQAVGYAFELDDRPDGLYGAFKVARGPEGDRALTFAEDKVRDGFSIGLGVGGGYTPRRITDGRTVNFAQSMPLRETSLVSVPSFDDSRVQSVAASATQEGTPTMTDPVTDPAPEVVADAPDFAALTGSIEQLATLLQNPQGIAPREASPDTATFQVTDEPLSYRFDGVANAHGHTFAEDLRAAFTEGDGEARQRVEEFMDVAFAVSVSNASALNPTQNRPDLYVGQLAYSTPLWDMVSTGSLTDKTPFTIPKFNSASGLVGAHTEGAEPTPGAFTATSQTITPTALSGKIEINREVWDQGGSPQADQIIWNEMLNAWYEAREATIATMLNGLSAATLLGGAELNLASAVDDALVDAVTGMLADMQFVRGGNRYTSFASDGLLFKALIQAKDADGRALLPVVGAQNAQGGVSPAFDRVMLGNLPARAAWPLGATNASHSYLFVPSSVWAWASTPKRFTFEYQVKSIDMALWGYSVAACIRNTDVKRIDYTTADS